MNVAALQQFLRSMVAALNTTDGGMRVAQDLERACRGLEPFRALDLDAFNGFLERCEEQRRNGNVTVSSEFDLTPVQQSLQKLGEARNRMESASGDSAKNELLAAQRTLNEQLTPLMEAVGLTGKLKADPKWVDRQLERSSAQRHTKSLRSLASRLTEPAAFDTPEVREEISRLEKEITAGEWKLLSSEFSLDGKAKGSKGVLEVLFKLTGHRPAKAKSTRAPVVVDAAKVAEYIDRLRPLLERAKTETEIPEALIDEQLNQLEGLSKEELIAVAKQCDIASPGKSVGEVLNKIRNRLSAGRRVQEQTAV